MKPHQILYIAIILLSNFVLTTFANTFEVISGTGLNNATGNAISGDTIKICSNIKASIGFTITKNLTIDLNGYYIELEKADYNLIETQNSCNLKIIDSSDSKSGLLNNKNQNSSYASVAMKSTGVLDIEDVRIEGLICIFQNSGTVNITNCTINAGYRGVSSKAVLNIYSGTIYGKTNAIRIATDKCNIYGGQFSSDDGDIISTNNCSPNITGGYFSKTVTPSNGYYLNDNIDASTKEAYPYCVNNNHLTYYSGSKTENSGAISKTGWTTIQTSSPNAMAVVSSDYATWSEDQTNIIVKDGDNYTCQNLVLTDLKDFYAPCEFTATSVTYTRSTTLTYNSLCLPFDLTSEDVNGTIYTFGNYDSANSNVTMKEQTGGVAAGVPCIFKSNIPNTTLTITKENAAINSSVDNTGTLKGRYITDTYFGGTGIYKLNSSGTAFGYTTSSAKCSPFRSYLDLTGIQAKESILNIVWNEGVTEINSIKNNVTSEYPTEHYSIDGMKVSSPVPGLNLIRKNGHFIKTTYRK